MGKRYDEYDVRIHENKYPKPNFLTGGKASKHLFGETS
jgi:hypothetical protein